MSDATPSSISEERDTCTCALAGLDDTAHDGHLVDCPLYADVTAGGAEAERMLRRHMAMYRWSKREAVAINDFILTVREGVAEAIATSRAPLTATLAARVAELEAENARLTQAVPVAEWHEDDGPAMWWDSEIGEPPYVGTPLDDDFPIFATHFTRIGNPIFPPAATLPPGVSDDGR